VVVLVVGLMVVEVEQVVLLLLFVHQDQQHIYHLDHIQLQ